MYTITCFKNKILEIKTTDFSHQFGQELMKKYGAEGLIMDGYNSQGVALKIITTQ